MHSVLSVEANTNPELKEWLTHVENFLKPFKELNVPVQVIFDILKSANISK
jgi:hypothetical protein